MKKHTITHWSKNAPKAYVSNGFTGFRIGKNAFDDISGLLAGFTTFRNVEALAVVPAPHLSFSYKRETVLPEIKSQSYDFSNGEFTTEAVLDCDGHSVALTYTVFCSRTSPTLFIGTVTAKGELPDLLKMMVRFEMQSHRFTVSELNYAEPYTDPVTSFFDGRCHVVSADRTTDAGIAYRLFGSFYDKQYKGEMTNTAVIAVDGSPVHIVTSYVPGVMHTEPFNQAQRLVTLAAWTGIDVMIEKNRRAWAKLWESRIVVDGAEEKWQDAIDASYFYLMSSASQFSPISIPPFGLSEPDEYEGHSFWDTESFMFMAPLFCAPEIADSMLKYRIRRIDAAENNARLNGYRGIQFPWQSGASGCEVTVPWCSQAGEHHVNLDIALAFDGYARVHGDPGFIKENIWPVIRGVCEWIESRVEKTERGYEILHITGIDEGHDDVNNDAYSNTMSAKLLRSGSEYSVMLGLGERKKWLEIADNMYVNFFEDGVIRQYDGAPHRAGYSALMSYFPYGYSNGAASDKKTFECMVYEGNILAECHYPMQSGYLGIFPAWLGDRDFSLQVYEAGCLDFFCEPFYACTEGSITDPDDRIDPKEPLQTSFITGRGSLLSGLIMGLT